MGGGKRNLAAHLSNKDRFICLQVNTGHWMRCLKCITWVGLLGGGHLTANDAPPEHGTKNAEQGTRNNRAGYTEPPE